MSAELRDDEVRVLRQMIEEYQAHQAVDEWWGGRRKFVRSALLFASGTVMFVVQCITLWVLTTNIGGH